MNKLKFPNYRRLIVVWVLLSLWGIAFIYSGSFRLNVSNGAKSYATIVQPVIMFVIILSSLPLVILYKKKFYALMYKTAVLQFVFAYASLVVVIILKVIDENVASIDLTRGGANQVIPLGAFDYQPLEFYKIALILFFAFTIGKHRRTRSLQEIFIPCAIIFSGCCLVLFQPDTGGFVIITSLLVVLTFINGQHFLKLFKWFSLFVVAMSAIVFLALGVLLNSTGYRVDRINAYLKPFEGETTYGANIINSVVAISNGGVTGVGYLNSVQSSGYLYASYNDFIFAVICEELGLIGACVTIGLLCYFSYLCFQIANDAHSRFGTLFAYGYGSLILIQSFVNIGGVIGLIPMTGVTLPFISSGINSYVFLSLGFIYVTLIELEARRVQKEKNERADKLFMPEN